MDRNKYEENEGATAFGRHPQLNMGYGPSVACTVGCTWLIYGLCTMAFVCPIYEHMRPYPDSIFHRCARRVRGRAGRQADVVRID